MKSLKLTKNSSWRIRPLRRLSRTKEQQDKVLAEEMVKTFLDRQAWKTSEIIEVEQWIRLEIEGRKIRGKVDRVDSTDDGLIIYDYKTSKSRTSRPNLRKDFQIGLYHLGVSQKYGKPVQSIGHWYLRMDQEWMVELTEEEVEAVVERVKAVIAGVEAGEFGAVPGYRQCMYCDYQELCDVR